MSLSLKRISKLEDSERQRIAAEFERLLEAMTDDELALYIADGEPYKKQIDFDSLTDEHLDAIKRCEVNSDGSRPSIAALKIELAHLIAWLAKHQAAQMTANDSQ